MWSGVAQGRDAVGDDEGGAALHDGVQVVEDGFFGVGIDRGRARRRG